mgnify:CR=1 FL=1
MSRLSGHNATTEDIAQDILDAYANLWSLTKKTYADLGMKPAELAGDTPAEERESGRLLETYDYVSKVGGQGTAIEKMQGRLQTETDPKRRNNLALRIIKARIHNGEATISIST